MIVDENILVQGVGDRECRGVVVQSGIHDWRILAEFGNYQDYEEPHL